MNAIAAAAFGRDRNGLGAKPGRAVPKAIALILPRISIAKSLKNLPHFGYARPYRVRG